MPTRKALSTAAMSMASWASAPTDGVRYPAAAKAMQMPLAAMPPIALWRAIVRIRRPMWMS